MHFKGFRPVSPIYAYFAAALIALTCWYGWTYEVFPYGGDLEYIGPLARLADWISKPVTVGVRVVSGVNISQPQPENALTALLLIWLLWFSCIRTVIAGWNHLAYKWMKAL